MTPSRVALISVSVVVFSAWVTGCAAAEPPAPTETESSNYTVVEEVSRCLADKGWDIVDASEGEARVPPEQMQLYNADAEACTSEVLGDVSTDPLTDSELADLFLVESDVAECLERLGYVVELPSLQVFIDGYRSGEPFTSFSALFGIPEAEWKAANQACPQAALVYQR